MRMRYVGKTGLSVSSLGLGTMTWGEDTDEHDAKEQLRIFLDAGGTLVDCAPAWGAGASEEILGSQLGSSFSRDAVTICTKGGLRRTSSGAQLDNSRSGLLADLDSSLARLNTDYIDLWLVHAPCDVVPFEETLATLNNAVTQGKVRYVGLSNHPAWRVAQAAVELRAQGAGLAACQNEYSLLQREAERELLPAAEALGVGLLAYSPIGRGVLTGKYRHGIPADSRAAAPHLAHLIEPYLDSGGSAIADAVATAAEGLGCASLDIALAWVLGEDTVASAIVGARTPAQLSSILAADDLELPDEIAAVLNEISTNRE